MCWNDQCSCGAVCQLSSVTPGCGWLSNSAHHHATPFRTKVPPSTGRTSEESSLHELLAPTGSSTGGGMIGVPV